MLVINNLAASVLLAQTNCVESTREFLREIQKCLLISFGMDNIG